MHNSNQNSNFLLSKRSVSAQNSQYCLEQNDLTNRYNDLMNKQNLSYQLNKSNISYASGAGVKDKSRYIPSNSKSIFLCETKVRAHLLPIYQNQANIHMPQQKSITNNNRNSVRKSHHSKLKVLTQSDLTQNYNEQEGNLFSNEENPLQDPKVHSIRENYNFSQKNKNQWHQSQTKLIKNPQQKPRNSQKTLIQQSQDQQSSLYEQNYIPPYTLIPSQKLEIKYCQVQDDGRRCTKKLTSLEYLISLIPQDFSLLKNIKKLIVTNCFMSSLQGIEYFDNLQQINFRKNQLREVQHLYKVKNKHKITSINIMGNDIEHYHHACYRNLSQVFTSLTQLNDKNYSRLTQKNHSNMNKVLKQSAKIQYELRKTLRKETRKTDKALFKFNSSSTCQQQTNRTKHNQCPDIFNKKTEQDDYDYFNDQNFSSREGSISKRLTTQSKIPIFKDRQYEKNNFDKRPQIDEQNDVYQIQTSNLNPNSYSLGQSNSKLAHLGLQKVNHRVQPLKQVSLGNLQNVPITKSIKCGEKSERSPSKMKLHENKQNLHQNNFYQNDEIPLQTVPIGRNLLEIKTEGLDNASDMSGHLHQPTATFAMQRQKQQKYSQQNKQFMFKNQKSFSNFETKSKLKKSIQQRDQVSQQQFFSEDEENQLSMSRLSKISQIPTKRVSNNNRKFSAKNQMVQREIKSKYEIYGGTYDNKSQQSFMTVHQYNGNTQNTSYLMGCSMNYSQFKPNDSMDQDCLLKDKNDGMQEERIVLAATIYLKNLAKKSWCGLILDSKKRKNLPRRRTFF